MSDKPPFVRQEAVDKPGIVGAKWWHQTLADESAKLARRAALKSIVIGGALVAGAGFGIAACIKGASSDGVPSDSKEERKTALELQKDFGWSFGANDEALVFDGVTEKPFDTNALALLATSLEPARGQLSPYYLRTLFEASYATPRALAQLPSEQAEGFKPLHTVLKPIATPAMSAAYEKGKILASIFDQHAQAAGTDPKIALVVDLPGPEAVAFAAGAATRFDPVFLFDNWPHPRGVVKAHETLAAAAYYQPLFDKERAAGDTKKPPMFVLDRQRLTPYTDDATQFDNRYVAKLPSPASALSSLGVQNLLYVVPTIGESTAESDDLNDDFLSYKTAGLDVRALSLDVLRDADFPFFSDYPWATSNQVLKRPSQVNPGRSFTPSPRVTAFSSGVATGAVAAKPRPPTFGTTPVLVALGTGLVLGSRHSRSGSWNRASGGFWS